MMTVGVTGSLTPAGPAADPNQDHKGSTARGKSQDRRACTASTSTISTTSTRRSCSAGHSLSSPLLCRRKNLISNKLLVARLSCFLSSYCGRGLEFPRKDWKWKQKGNSGQDSGRGWTVICSTLPLLLLFVSLTPAWQQMMGRMWSLRPNYLVSVLSSQAAFC